MDRIHKQPARLRYLFKKHRVLLLGVRGEHVYIYRPRAVGCDEPYGGLKTTEMESGSLPNTSPLLRCRKDVFRKIAGFIPIDLCITVFITRARIQKKLPYMAEHPYIQGLREPKFAGHDPYKMIPARERFKPMYCCGQKRLVPNFSKWMSSKYAFKEQFTRTA